MAIQETRCPRCNASVRGDPRTDEVTCEFCEQTFSTGPDPPAAHKAGSKASMRRDARTIVIVVVGVVGVVLAGVLGTCLFAASQAGKALSVIEEVAARPKVQGRVVSEGGALGDFTIDLTSCRGGDAYGFHGVDVFIDGDDRPRLRYFRDPARGDLITVTIPGTDQGLVLGRDSCKTLDGEIEKHGYGGGRTSVRWAFDGRLRFDCVHSGGTGHVSGSMTFRDCM